MTTRRLDVIAREVVAEGNLPADPDEAADYVAGQIRLERPDVTARSAQAAAAAAVPGAAAPLTSAQERDALEDLDRRSARGRARAGASGAGRRAARAGRRLTRRRDFRNPLAGASTAAGLLAQAFGLTVLYWLLRTPDAVDAVTAGAVKLVRWVTGPGGVPVPAAAAGASTAGITGIVTAPVGAPGGIPAQADRGDPVERWRPLVARYFPAHAVAKAMDVLACESEGNPYARNPTSGAAGLFQHIPRYFDARAAAAGFPGASPFDPEANVAAAAWLWRREGWSPWACA